MSVLKMNVKDIEKRIGKGPFAAQIATNNAIKLILENNDMYNTKFYDFGDGISVSERRKLATFPKIFAVAGAITKISAFCAK